MTDIDITKDIFEKEVCCPVCDSKFKATSVKVNSPRVLSKDSDLFIRYSTVNPYFYDVWVCDSCGYAALKSDFPKLKSYQKDLVLKNITAKWRPRTFPATLDENLAIERYKLALITASTIEKPNSTLGILLLKTGWMYRLLNNEEHEQIFLSQALETLSKAYMLEDFPIYGMQRDSLSYLIADLHRLTGNNDTALKWYSSVITASTSSAKVKDLARSGKDLIKSKHIE